MKSYLLFLVLIIALHINLSAQFKVNALPSGGHAPTLDYLLNNSHMGTEFILAVPQNDKFPGGEREIGIEIIVTSVTNTLVKLYVPETDKLVTKEVEAFNPIVFSSKTGEVSFSLESRESEVVTFKTVIITSSEPISVYFITVKEYSAEGYLAIPVCQWGKEYYHVSYYDFAESERKCGSGFIIVASEDGTNVNINLNGEGKGFATTVGGKNIGDKVQVSLNRGQAYMIRGDGLTKGVFDISGTYITSNYPIGVISFHMRTMIPSQCPEDRDNLAEMLPPLHCWGNKYVTVQFERQKSSTQLGDGDLFRVVASKNSTRVDCDMYNILTQELIGKRTVNLNSGQFAELDAIKDINNKNTKTSIRGISIWQSDKPFMLNQYAFSSEWDGDKNYAPLQIVLAPVNQYVKSTIFQSPINLNFNENIVTLFAVNNPNDPNNSLLKSVKLDGNEIYSKLISNRIPGTDIHWARIMVGRGVHTIESQTQVNAFMNGLISRYSYGWAVGYNFNKIDEYDDQPPQIEKTNTCGDYKIKVTETQNGYPLANQRDQGISKILFVQDLSYNYDFELVNPELFKPQMKMTVQYFNLKLLDEKKPAKAIFVVLDRAGNYAFDSVVYEPPSVTLSKENIDFGKVRLQKNVSSSISFTNNAENSITIQNIRLNKASVFRIESIQLPHTVQPKESFVINFSYTPIKESLQNCDFDTLQIITECIEWEVNMKGCGIVPHIAISEDYNIDTVKIGDIKCLEEVNKQGIKIANSGTDTLIVTAVSKVNAPFIIKLSEQGGFPFIIPPKGEVYFKSICFVPSDTNEYSVQITFSSDSDTGDSTTTVKAKGYMIIDNVNDNIFSDDGIYISPNPVNELLTINLKSLSNNTINNIRVINSLGQIVLEFNNINLGVDSYQYKISTERIPDGFYYILINSNNKIIVKKFVKSYFN